MDKDSDVKKAAEKLINAKEYTKAIQLLEDYLSKKPGDAEAWNILGVAFYSIGDLKRAEECFKKSLEHNPRDPDVWYNLGALCKREGRVDEAIDYYKKYLEFESEDSYTWNSLGTLFYSKGDLSEAEKCFRRAYELSPEDPVIVANLCVTLRDQNKISESIEICDKALRLLEKRVKEDPSEENLSFLAFVYMKCFRNAEAEKIYREIIEKNP
ncbi:MAG TPA: tetratricopeptide repeat protein, partial [Thermoprotei archaeon]|nr:tetratricopeptide repeat protein [Thermoprotei archaeon]